MGTFLASIFLAQTEDVWHGTVKVYGADADGLAVKDYISLLEMNMSLAQKSSLP